MYVSTSSGAAVSRVVACISRYVQASTHSTERIFQLPPPCPSRSMYAKGRNVGVRRPYCLACCFLL